ncbi:cell division regulator GpsB [Viridibacillus sp. NPDC096237]|uniref:cell division regulator GpsB n=1 Tax=Viridibacillus sp. NPDC096237 TaxID=3390721 RepID=UPI003D022A15
MYMDTKLTAKKILDKDFKTGLRGYSQDDVDQFLDEIIQDYENFEKIVAKKQEEINMLKQELEAAQNSKRHTSAQVQPQQPQHTANTNFDILKRISNLEKHVFGDKLYD